MASEYRLDVYTPIAPSSKAAEIADFLYLHYRRELGQVGHLEFTLKGDHPAIPLLQTNSLVVVYRRNADWGPVDWQADFWGLFRKSEHTTDEDGRELLRATCPDGNTLLTWRIVAWQPERAGYSLFEGVAGETVMKSIVTTNLGGGALTSLGRVRDGVMSNVSVELDGARGDPVSVETSWRTVLEVLQEIMPKSGGYFDMISLHPVQPTNWQFRYFPTMRGQDRRATVHFALEWGNMGEVEMTYDRLEEKTVAIAVGGIRSSTTRRRQRASVFTGPDYSATNDIEMFVDASDANTQEKLETAAREALEEKRARKVLRFDVVQTPSCAYGVHYAFGDWVKATYRGETFDQEIKAVDIELNEDGEERISIETATPLFVGSMGPK